jgi:hypothetical protein
VGFRYGWRRTYNVQVAKERLETEREAALLKEREMLIKERDELKKGICSPMINGF